MARFVTHNYSVMLINVVRQIYAGKCYVLGKKPTSFPTIHEVRKITKITQAGKTLGQQGSIMTQQNDLARARKEQIMHNIRATNRQSNVRVHAQCSSSPRSLLAIKVLCDAVIDG